MTSVDDCKIVDLEIKDTLEGSSIEITGNKQIPFQINRIYYMYGIPEGETRGDHAHENLHQLIIASGGSFDILLDDGRKKKEVTLNSPEQGLLVVPGIWRNLSNFSAGVICLVYASQTYEDNIVIRDYKDFVKFKGIE